MPRATIECDACLATIAIEPRHAGSSFKCPSCRSLVSVPKDMPFPAVLRVPCPFCAEDIAETAIKCRYCNEFLDGRSREPKYALATMRRWSGLVAMILSLIVPGLGQLYKGQLINGIAWFVLVIAGYATFVIPGLALHLFCVLGAGMGNPYR